MRIHLWRTLKGYNWAMEITTLPLVVGIAGGSGSGKTTLAEAILMKLAESESLSFRMMPTIAIRATLHLKSVCE